MASFMPGGIDACNCGIRARTRSDGIDNVGARLAGNHDAIAALPLAWPLPEYLHGIRNRRDVR